MLHGYQHYYQGVYLYLLPCTHGILHYDLYMTVTEMMIALAGNHMRGVDISYAVNILL
jgi:hypothetical protein